KLFTPLREDKVEPSLSVEDALRNAPAVAGSSLRVPKVIE
ncbi:MAG: Asp-tRNA(Asn)/Glu-tRNA(Gln) amidotransferase subunit GatC, partial [Thermodesulfobacteriota bacterium]